MNFIFEISADYYYYFLFLISVSSITAAVVYTCWRRHQKQKKIAQQTDIPLSLRHIVHAHTPETYQIESFSSEGELFSL